MRENIRQTIIAYNKKHPLTLMDGIANISQMLTMQYHMGIIKQPVQITAIQYEDGSCLKFNYQVNGGEWQFIDFSDAANLLRTNEIHFSNGQYTKK